MTSQLKARYENYLQANQLKSSKIRDVIVEHILQIQGHFTVDNIYQDIYETEPGIGIATVYRTVKLLVEGGILMEHTFGEKKGWFEIVDLKLQPHDHLICTSCGAIIEFNSREFETIKNQVATAHRFNILSHKLEIYGLCSHCQNQ